jgi:hypothetical protein
MAFSAEPMLAADRPTGELCLIAPVPWRASAASRGSGRAFVSPVLAALVVALACAGADARGSAEERRAALGESFPLRVGESAFIEAEALRIGFGSVPADSRCPKGETCIWEGDATVRIWVERGSGEKGMLDLHTSARGGRAAGWEDWSIRLLSLDPYPISGRTIRTEDYVATLEVTRGSAAEGEVR